MDVQEIYEKAYALMDETVVPGNCGTLCNYHCCREDGDDGEKMGIYLLPLEYESMIQGREIEKQLRITRHTNKAYEMPPKINSLYFVYCREDGPCLREHRPIQCRTYPFEPHIENEELFIIVQQEQIHQCPLLKTPETWRKEFIRGVYEGWRSLIAIPMVRHLIEYDSRERDIRDVQIKYSGTFTNELPIRLGK